MLNNPEDIVGHHAGVFVIYKIPHGSSSGIAPQIAAEGNSPDVDVVEADVICAVNASGSCANRHKDEAACLKHNMVVKHNQNVYDTCNKVGQQHCNSESTI